MDGSMLSCPVRWEPAGSGGAPAASAVILGIVVKAAGREDRLVLYDLGGAHVMSTHTCRWVSLYSLSAQHTAGWGRAHSVCVISLHHLGVTTVSVGIPRFIIQVGHFHVTAECWGRNVARDRWPVCRPEYWLVTAVRVRGELVGIREKSSVSPF